MSNGPSAAGAALRDSVASALVEVLGDTAVLSVTSTASAYSSSFPIQELRVVLEDGRVIDLVLKNLSWSAVLAGAQTFRSHHAHDPAREVTVYRRLLRDGPPGPPRFYGAVVDPEADVHWLLLERVPGLQLRHTGDIEAWTETARWVGRFHAAFASTAGVAAAVAARVPTLGADRLRSTLTQARAHLAKQASGEWDARFALVAARHEGIVDRLTRMPFCLVHGQLYPANIVVDRRADGWRVAVVDWETAALGAPAVDLAALTEGDWSAGERRRLLSSYLMSRDGVFTAAAEDELEIDVACARVHLALHLVTLPSSVVPADMAADWLGLAASVAEGLPW